MSVGQQVHDTTMLAVCRIRHGRISGRTLIVRPDFMMGERNYRTTKPWMRTLGRDVLTRVTDTTRLLLLVCSGLHHSVIELDLPVRATQHHDSMGIHSRNTRWTAATARLGRELLLDIRRRRGDTNIDEEEITIRPRRPIQPLRTQTIPDSNNCGLHVLHYIQEIIENEAPSPLQDEATNEYRIPVANEIYHAQQTLGTTIDVRALEQRRASPC